jgi:hypothetical protein
MKQLWLFNLGILYVVKSDRKFLSVEGLERSLDLLDTVRLKQVIHLINNDNLLLELFNLNLILSIKLKVLEINNKY